MQVGKEGGSSAARASIEVQEDTLDRVRTICLALPEVTVRVDASLTRTTQLVVPTAGRDCGKENCSRYRAGVVPFTRTNVLVIWLWS